MANTTTSPTVQNLKSFRSRFANEFREGFLAGIPEALQITYSLYEISSLLIVSVEEAEEALAETGNWRVYDKMALMVVQRKLENLINSAEFKKFDELGKYHICDCVTTGIKQHIRVMREVLRDLLGDADYVKQCQKILDEKGF